LRTLLIYYPLDQSGMKEYTCDESDKKSKPPSCIKESKKTAEEGGVESISTDDVELKTNGNEKDRTQESSRDGWELEIIADKVGQLIAWCSAVDCHCCTREQDSVFRGCFSQRNLCFSLRRSTSAQKMEP